MGKKLMGKKTAAGLAAGGVAAAVAATMIALVAPVAAQTDGKVISAGQSSATDRPAYCDRIDRALDKRQRVVARIEGDAGTRGSIAWLNEKAAAAAAAGSPEVATLFTDRAALRSQVLDPLKTLVTDLTAVQQKHCS